MDTSSSKPRMKKILPESVGAKYVARRLGEIQGILNTYRGMSAEFIMLRGAYEMSLAVSEWEDSMAKILENRITKTEYLKLGFSKPKTEPWSIWQHSHIRKQLVDLEQPHISEEAFQSGVLLHTIELANDETS